MMERKDCIAKIMEMFDSDRKFVKSKAVSALESGAIEIDDFANDYKLPKIILHVCYKRLMESRRPLHPENKDEAMNLENFI